MTTTAPSVERPSRRSAGQLAASVLDQGVYVLLVIVLAIGIITSPQFRTADNLLNVLRSVSLVGIAALGVSFVTMCGSFVDLSVASIVSVSAVVGLAVAGTNPVLAVLAALAAGLVIGLANGALVSRFNANPILLTLATTTIVGGLLLLATGGQVTYAAEGGGLQSLVNSRLGSVPVTVIVLLVLTALCHWALTYSTWGRRLLAVGGNQRTALYAGLRVGRTRAQAFALSGLLAGLTGLLLGASLGSATPTAGTGYEFDAFTAAVIGGTRLTGGRGSAIGVLAGAVLIGLLSNLLVLSGAPYSLQQVVKGLILVIVVGLGQILRGSRG